MTTPSAAWHKRLIAILAILAVPVLALPDVVAQSEQVRTVALGESNNETQRAEILSYLEVTDTDQVVTVTVDDTVQAMDGVFDVSFIDSAYSSTAVTCYPAGSGITVSTRNIEAIPPELYALALLTAGMRDVQLAVVAPNDAPALGMTAMTGVFTTSDLAPCPGSANDPARQQLALEQLALVAEIGQDPETVRQVTRVVLDVQQEIVGQQVTPDELDMMVTSRFQAAGVALTDESLAEITGFLDRLSRAEIDWGTFAHGWSTQPTDDGSGIVVTATADTVASRPDVTAMTGVGGPTGPIGSAPSPSATALPAVTEPIPVTVTTTSTPASTPVIDNDAPSGVTGTVTEPNWSGVLPWWPLAAGFLAILLLVSLLARGLQAYRRASNRPNQDPLPWYLDPRYRSPRRVSWPKRMLRRLVTHTRRASPSQRLDSHESLYR